MDFELFNCMSERWLLNIFVQVSFSYKLIETNVNSTGKVTEDSLNDK